MLECKTSPPVFGTGEIMTSEFLRVEATESEYCLQLICAIGRSQSQFSSLILSLANNRPHVSLIVQLPNYKPH